MGGRKKTARARIGMFPALPQTLLLKPGDMLVLHRENMLGRKARYGKTGEFIEPAQISVSLPELLDHAKPGEPVWLDDGKIGGVFRAVDSDSATVEITQARPEGERLGAEKGINLPETRIGIPALTPDNLEALKFIVQHADLVDYSFVRIWKCNGRLNQAFALPSSSSHSARICVYFSWITSSSSSLSFSISIIWFFCIVDRVNQLVEFQVDCACVTILRVLDDEDHQERDDGCARIDDQLPSIGVAEDGPVSAQTAMTTIAPTNAHFEPSQLEAAAANLPKASPWVCLRPLSAITGTTSR
jgi:hypothetical protein